MSFLLTTKALKELSSDGLWQVNQEEDGDIVITWLDGAVEVSQTDIDAKVAELSAQPDPAVAGNQKLLDLGLTQAEATALTGYTPPEE